MRLEVQSAAEFLMNMLRVPVTPTIKAMSEPQLVHFKGSLQMLLVLRYRSHWYPDTPNKGSGYRCIRINSKMDPLVAQAGRSVGCSSKLLSKMLPPELTLWVDPEEVSYRIGENGSICVLYDSQQSRSSPSSDSESIDSSDDLFMEQFSRIDSNQMLELMENSDFLNSIANCTRLSNRLDSSGSADSSLRSPPPSSPLQLNNRLSHFNHQSHHHHQQSQHHQQQQQQQQQQRHHQPQHHLQYNNVMHRNGGGNSPHHNHHHHQVIGSMVNGGSNCMDSRLYHWEGFVNNSNNKVRTQC